MIGTAKANSLPYRSGVGIILLNSEGKVFAAKRIDTKSEAWQMPQGGIDEGETAKEAAMRELGEEEGTSKAKIIAESKDWYFYDLPDNLISKVWGGKYRGQKQKWFVMQFLGADKDINIQTPEPEFCEWKWAKASDLIDMIVPFKRDLYEKLFTEFKSYL